MTTSGRHKVTRRGLEEQKDYEDFHCYKADVLESTIGCRSEEKQKEECTLAGEKFKLMVTKEDDSGACRFLVGFLVSNRSSMRISKSKKHLENSSLACRVLNCIDANFEYLQC